MFSGLGRLQSRVGVSGLGLACLCPLGVGQVRWATKAAAGTTKNGRDSKGRRHGLKKGNLEAVRPGMILVRQNGTKWKPGEGVLLGRDYTISADIVGRVVFTKCPANRWSRSKKPRSVVNVFPFPKKMEEVLVY